MSLEQNIEAIKTEVEATVKLLKELLAAGEKSKASKTSKAPVTEIAPETTAEKVLGETDSAQMFLKVQASIQKMAANPEHKAHAIEILKKYGAVNKEGKPSGAALKPEQYVRFMHDMAKKQAELDAPKDDDLV